MNTQKILYWIVLLVTAFIFGSAGAMKAFGVAQLHHNRAEMHYPEWFTYLLGFAELAGVAGLFVARTRFYVIVLFLIIIFGGIGSHIAAGHGLDRLSFALIGLAGLLILIWLQKPSLFKTPLTP